MPPGKSEALEDTMANKIGNIVFVLACIILVCDTSSLEEVLIKCHITDDMCQTKMFATLITAVQSGYIDLGVKPIDPCRMSNITVNILDLVDFTLVDGKTTGIKNCEFVSLTTHIERQLANMHTSCNIKIEGTFKVSTSSPVIQKIFGKPIFGEGDGTLELNDLNMFFEFHYNARKGDDGEYYLKSRPKEIKHKYIYSGKTTLIADSLISDNQDANDFILNFLEENSSFIKASIGSAYIAKVMEFYYDFNEKFFDTVPAKNYILDDLTPLIKN